MTSSAQNRSETRDAMSEIRYLTLKEAAAKLDKSAQHLWRCLRASRDERIRKSRRISMRLLRNLPLEGWRQIGATWVIAETDFYRQMKDSR